MQKILLMGPGTSHSSLLAGKEVLWRLPILIRQSLALYKRHDLKLCTIKEPPSHLQGMAAQNSPHVGACPSLTALHKLLKT